MPPPAPGPAARSAAHRRSVPGSSPDRGRRRARSRSLPIPCQGRRVCAAVGPGRVRPRLGRPLGRRDPRRGGRVRPAVDARRRAVGRRAVPFPLGAVRASPCAHRQPREGVRHLSARWTPRRTRPSRRTRWPKSSSGAAVVIGTLVSGSGRARPGRSRGRGRWPGPRTRARRGRRAPGRRRRGPRPWRAPAPRRGPAPRRPRTCR